jgi:hypothetical protein
MVASTVIVSCIRRECSKRLRVPSNRGQLTIICPNCKISWDWVPENPEIRTIQFRCSQTGNVFYNTFSRTNTSDLYKKISTNLKSDNSEQIETCSTLELTTQQNNLDNLSLFKASEFDFSDFYCICCGHSQFKQEWPPFIHCATCKEYVCGGRVVGLENGSQIFQCHDNCSGGGCIEGEIKALSGASNQKLISQITKALPLGNEINISLNEK